MKLTPIVSIAVVSALLVVAAVVFYLKGETSAKAQLARARILSETDKLDALYLVRATIPKANDELPEARLLECQLLLDLKRGKEAFRAFAAISQPERIDPETLCRLAEKAHSVGSEVLAGQAYLAAGEFARKNALHMRRLIFAIYSEHDQNHEDMVLELCQEFTKRWPEDAYPWLVSAAIYGERNVPQLAFNALREALKCEASPLERNDARINLARVSLSLGNIAMAREQCDALLATDLDVKSQQLLPTLLAEVLMREGKSNEALKVLANVNPASSSSAEVQALRGRCRYDLDDYQGAIDDLTLALKQNPFDHHSHYLISQAYLKVQNKTMAERHLNRFRELSEILNQIAQLENQLRNDLNNRELKQRLAELNERRGEFQKAAAWKRAVANSTQP